MVYHNTRLPLLEVHTKRITTTRCSYQNTETVAQQHVASPAVYASTRRSLHQWYTQNKHATTRRLYRWHTQKSDATTRCLHQWYPQKQSSNKRVAFTGGKRKTITQQHAAFTGGTRKHSHAKTRNKTLPSPVVHKTVMQHVALTGSTRKTVIQQHAVFTSGTRKKQSRNNTLPSPVVHTKQLRNNTLPSPVVRAKNSHATTRCLHRWKTQIVTQRYVDLTRGHATTACCPHRRYS